MDIRPVGNAPDDLTHRPNFMKQRPYANLCQQKYDGREDR